MTRDEIEAMYHRAIARAQAAYDESLHEVKAKYADAVVMAGAEYDRAMLKAGYTRAMVERGVDPMDVW